MHKSGLVMGARVIKESQLKLLKKKARGTAGIVYRRNGILKLVICFQQI